MQGARRSWTREARVAKDPPVIDLLRNVVAAAARLFAPRAIVAAENLLLRHQLIVLRRSSPRPRLRRLDRWLIATLREHDYPSSRWCAPMPTFSAFAASLFEDKVKAGDIRSASGRVKWAQTLEHHLLPAFGPYLLDQLRHADIAQWRVQMAGKIHDGTYSPHTANKWLQVMRLILKAAVMQFELPRNPVDCIKNSTRASTATRRRSPTASPWKRCPASCRRCGSSARSTSLSCALVSSWGIVPRRCDRFGGQGATPDVDFDEGNLLVQRSHTEGDEVMARTMTKIRQRITLPPVLIDILRWHVDTQLTTDAMRESELLFPAEDGGFRSRSALKKPFVSVANAVGLKKHVSPKAMRRTFQDLARAAEVKDIVARAISGHATETMQHHYSTVAADEKKLAIAKVIELAGVRKALPEGTSGPGGMILPPGLWTPPKARICARSCSWREGSEGSSHRSSRRRRCVWRRSGTGRSGRWPSTWT
jgi:hypothetical protein